MSETIFGERCPRCDHHRVTDAHMATHPATARYVCDACRDGCRWTPCSDEPTDWRARALAAESALEEAKQSAARAIEALGAERDLAVATLEDARRATADTLLHAGLARAAGPCIATVRYLPDCDCPPCRAGRGEAPEPVSVAEFSFADHLAIVNDWGALVDVVEAERDEAEAIANEAMRVGLERVERARAIQQIATANGMVLADQCERA